MIQITETIKKYGWSQYEIDFLRQFYKLHGPEFCAQYLRRSIRSIYKKAYRVGIKTNTGWSTEEIDILENNFNTIGPTKCAKMLKKKKVTVQAMARKLGLKTEVSCGRPKKEMINNLSGNRAIMFCKHHGSVEFYIQKSGKPVCLICSRIYANKYSKTLKYKARRRIWQKHYRNTKLGNYEHRLRGRLRFASRGGISYTKDLPYCSQELCDYLEAVRKRQNNRCPMCNASYDIVGYDIDHITPTSSAKDVSELLSLFELSNLSLLCPGCNRHIKRDKIGVVYE